MKGGILGFFPAEFCERPPGHPMDEWKHYYTKWVEPATPSEEPDVFPVIWE